MCPLMSYGLSQTGVPEGAGRRAGAVGGPVGSGVPRARGDGRGGGGERCLGA